MLPESLVAARKLLEEITPLQTDCGLVCGGACCQTHPGEETGMLLFPGEAEMYRGEKGFTLVDSPGAVAARIVRWRAECFRW